MDAAAGIATDDNSIAMTSTLATELLARVREDLHRAHDTAHLPRDLGRRLDACERRAYRRSGDFGQGAALDFLGDAIAAVAVDDAFAPGEARTAVVAAAEEIGLAPETVAFAVFRRALASSEWVQLPPALVADLSLRLLVELAPAAASSLWSIDGRGAAVCLVSAGEAPRSRRLRQVARAALDGVLTPTAHVRVHVVERWDQPYAALVARRCRPNASVVDDYLAEAATALSPLLERTVLFERSAERERDLVAASERRLVRVGFDLHDGPLQELVALAEDLRLVESQVEGVVRGEDRSRVRGRFLDLAARLEALDTALRRVAHSARSTTALEQPIEDVVRRELDALGSVVPIETELTVEGELGQLTDSQRIVVFRVVQEALSNVRKHSGAASVSVAIRSTRAFLDVTVSDDGCGFDRRRKVDADRLGLAGVSERVRLLGGSVEIDSRPGTGTTVHATIPQWRPLSEQTFDPVYAVRP